MKKIFYLFLLVSTISFAQNVRFEGTIIDNNRAPLEMANVMAMNQGTKAMDAYAITNEKGKFILNLNANASYTIKLSYLGMQNKEITVTTQTQNITQNIYLSIYNDEMNRDQMGQVNVKSANPTSRSSSSCRPDQGLWLV